MPLRLCGWQLHRRTRTVRPRASFLVRSRGCKPFERNRYREKCCSREVGAAGEGGGWVMSPSGDALSRSGSVPASMLHPMAGGRRIHDAAWPTLPRCHHRRRCISYVRGCIPHSFVVHDRCHASSSAECGEVRLLGGPGGDRAPHGLARLSCAPRELRVHRADSPCAYESGERSGGRRTSVTAARDAVARVWPTQWVRGRARVARGARQGASEGYQRAVKSLRARTL